MNDKSPTPQKSFTVGVEGGSLHGRIWGDRGPVVLCLHGITANHTEFAFLAAQLGGECRIVAPDLRGRGRSNAIAGPWGMAVHAADMAAVLDHLAIPQADLVLGHSMGGFVAAVLAAQHPERVGKVLMVDGGVPLFRAGFITWMPFSEWIIERIVKKILGPSLARLDMTFASREDYLAFWRRHPSLARDWSPLIEAYLEYDLEGEAPSLRASTRKQALMRDVRTQLIEDLVPRSLAQIRAPVRFLRAAHGILGPKPLYDERKLVRAAASIARFSHVTVPDVNHFTILMSAHGARAVAEEVRQLLRE